MLRWRFWAGRRDRLALALVGVFILATGLSVISLLSDSVRGTVAKAYEQTWRTPYDILVHVPLPGGAQLPDIQEPNVLTTLPSGITLAQLDQVRQVDGVSVAAPLAVVGYMAAGPNYTVPSPTAGIPILPDGLYRFRQTISSTDPHAPQTIEVDNLIAFARKTKPDPAWPKEVPVMQDKSTVIASIAQIPVLLAGIDPDAESQLVGLDKSVIDGRYLKRGDKVDWRRRLDSQDETVTAYFPYIPVLVNLHAFRTTAFSIELEALNPDLSVQRSIWRQSLAPEQMLKAMSDGAEWETGSAGFYNWHLLLGKAGPIRYQATASPHPERWPAAVSLEPVAADVSRAFFINGPHQVTSDLGPTYRPWLGANPRLTAEKQEQNGTISYKTVGTFDSANMSMVKDSVTNMPLMNYRPADALQVLDAAGRPLNPPSLLSGGISPVGFLSSPPALITTIEGAVAVAGDGVINAIQIKVAGAEHFTPESTDRVRQIARAIEQRTGLVAEVVMGSSPVNMLIQTPPSASKPGFGWIEERWIHKNAAVTTVNEVEFGYSSFVMMILVVGVLFAITTALAGVTARRRELGLAVAVGWPGRAIAGLVVGEQLLFGLIAGLLAALAAASQGASPRAAGINLAMGLLMYLPAMIAAGYAAVRTAPGLALRWGDTAPGRRILSGTGVLSLAASSLMGRPVRILLTVVAIGLPSSLLLVLAFTSRHLQGVLYTTVTGQFAALKVGPVQYLMGVIALAIAAVTAYDLIHQNAVDHRQERAVLFAVGWPRWWIAATMVTEGVLLGATAGLVGDLLGLALLTALYGSLTGAVWPVALAVWALPVGLGLLTGLLAALLEMRAWDRTSLAGLRAGQVLRFSRVTVAAALVAVVALVAGLGRMVWPRLAAQLHSQATAAESPSARAVAEIEAAVATQNAAPGKLDIEAFAATIDPSAKPYLTQQRHRLEELKALSAGAVSRTVAHVALLGENSANVEVEERIAGSAPLVLSTVWVKLGDRWYEHGYQHQMLSTADAAVSYPDDVSEAAARETAANAVKAIAEAEAAGWQISRPVAIAFAGVEERERLKRLPGYLSAGNQYGPVFQEYGEPILVVTSRAPSAEALLVSLEALAVMERTHNQAAEWLAHSVVAKELYGRAGQAKPQILQKMAPAGPMTPDDLLRLHLDFNPYDAGTPRAMSTGALFLIFLEEKYGPKALPDILDRLAKLPEDARRSSPLTWDGRNQATVQAFEQRTGESWANLNKAFQDWVHQ